MGEAGAFDTVTPAHGGGTVEVTISAIYVNDAGIDASASSTLTAGYTYGVPADEAGVPDGGSGGGDASTTRVDGGSGNADAGSSDDSGCGCDLPGADSSAISFVPALLAIGALFRARRRRRR